MKVVPVPFVQSNRRLLGFRVAFGRVAFGCAARCFLVRVVVAVVDGRFRDVILTGSSKSAESDSPLLTAVPALAARASARLSAAAAAAAMERFSAKVRVCDPSSMV